MKPTIRSLALGVGGLAALGLPATATKAQSYYDDAACRQYADQATAPMRAQATNQAVGSTLLGAGLGAAIGGAVGGGRGAGIGAASGAVAGTLGGAANAQDANAYIAQQYNAYYAQCMQSRSTPQPAYAPPPGYAPAAPSASQLNQQELYRQGYPPPR